MTRYRIMYWKHIPQSFTVEGEGRTVKKQLSEKIQNKIDAYAMAEGLTSTSDYSAQYKRGAWVERDGSPEEVAAKIVSVHELFRPERYLAHISIGAVSHHDVLRAIELFGTQVAPIVERETAANTTA